MKSEEGKKRTNREDTIHGKGEYIKRQTAVKDLGTTEERDVKTSRAHPSVTVLGGSGDLHGV